RRPAACSPPTPSVPPTVGRPARRAPRDAASRAGRPAGRLHPPGSYQARQHRPGGEDAGPACHADGHRRAGRRAVTRPAATVEGGASMTLSQLYLALLVGGFALLASIASARMASRLRLPSLLLFLAVGVLLGEDVLGLQFDNAQLAQTI